MSHLSFHLKCQGHLHLIQIPSSFKARAKMQKRQKYVLICVDLCYGMLWTLISADSKCTDLEIRFCSALQYTLWSSNEKLRIHTENLEELCTAEASSSTHSGCEMKSINGIQRTLHATESLQMKPPISHLSFFCQLNFLGRYILPAQRPYQALGGCAKSCKLCKQFCRDILYTVSSSYYRYTYNCSCTSHLDCCRQGVPISFEMQHQQAINKRYSGLAMACRNYWIRCFTRSIRIGFSSLSQKHKCRAFLLKGAMDMWILWMT